jgi:hypothetical protein
MGLGLLFALSLRWHEPKHSSRRSMLLHESVDMKSSEHIKFQWQSRPTAGLPNELKFDPRKTSFW